MEESMQVTSHRQSTKNRDAQVELHTRDQHISLEKRLATVETTYTIKELTLRVSTSKPAFH
jgi:hypothetical protein